MPASCQPTATRANHSGDRITALHRTVGPHIVPAFNSLPIAAPVKVANWQSVGKCGMQTDELCQVLAFYPPYTKIVDVDFSFQTVPMAIFH